MSTFPYPFSCSLFPHLAWQGSQGIARFLLPTSWQICRPARKNRPAGVVSRPRLIHSMLVLDELYWSVLPFNLRTSLGINIQRIDGPGPALFGVPCDLGRVHVWLLRRELPLFEAQLLALPFLLPHGPLPVEPFFPLFGQEFLRTLGWRVTLDFPIFPTGAGLLLTAPSPVGRLDMD